MVSVGHGSYGSWLVLTNPNDLLTMGSPASPSGRATLTMALLTVARGRTECGYTHYGAFSIRSVNSISGSSVCPHSRYLPISRRRSAAWG